MRLLNGLSWFQPGGGGPTPYDGQYGAASPERGIFFRLQIYERVGISLVAVYKKVGKSVIWVCERSKKANRWIYGFLKSRKRAIFLIDCYLKDNAFTALKRDTKF